MRSWVIGSGADCDVVVDSPLVSSRHCRLTQTRDGFLLDDLGSTNGTYVNGLRIATPTRVTPGEPITLGRTVPMPWPPEVVRFIGIGRLPDNDIVLDDARVSSHHARLIVVAGSGTLIEDLGSANGTFLNSRDQRATQAIPLTEADTVNFGTLSVPAARLLAGLKDPEAEAPDPQLRTAATKPTATLPALALLEGNHWIPALMVQAPIFAVLIVLIFRHRTAARITPSSWSSVAQGIGSTTFALALAAVWLGCSIAVAEFAAGRLRGLRESVDSTTRSVFIGSRLAILIALCAVECALLLAIVHWRCGLRGPWLAMWGMLVMASGVGLLFGLVVTALCRTGTTAAVVLVLSFLAMIALGGPLLPRRLKPAVWLAAAMPTRWAFEGLIVLEADASPTFQPSDDGPHAVPIDLAEPNFPATKRMGPRAAALALAGMFVGLAALSVAMPWKPKTHWPLFAGRPSISS